LTASTGRAGRRVALQDGDGRVHRIPALDGLRAVAVAGVLCAHLRIGLPQAGVGVNVFFVLSGFLITTLLLREREGRGTIALGRFYVRRLLRLYPALLVVVLAVAAYSVVLVDDPVLATRTEHTALTSLLYVTNWERAFGGNGGMLAHTWSLSIEEQFYLVWPLALLVAHRVAGARGVLVLALAGSVGALGLRFLLWDDGAGLARIYNGTDTEADQLLLGAALAVLVARSAPLVARAGRLLAPVGAAFVVAVAVSALTPEMQFTWGATGVALGAAAVIGHVVTAPEGAWARALSVRPLVAVGRISYGLYLWHFPVTFVVGDRLPGAVGRSVGVVAVSLVAAALSYRLVEQPILRARDRRDPATATAQASLGTT
jgi:peptidoglycan/LPS O-acetylase OafA/YrhL